MERYGSVEEVYSAYKELLITHLSSFLKAADDNFSLFQQSKELLPQKLAHIKEKEIHSGFMPAYYIQQCFGLSDMHKAAMMCVYFSAVDGEFGYICTQITQRSRFLDVNDIIGLLFGSLKEFLKGRNYISYLFQFDSRDAMQYNMPLLLHNRIFALLCGEEIAYASPYFQICLCGGSSAKACVNMVGNGAEKEALLSLMRKNEEEAPHRLVRREENQAGGVVAIVGESGSGRKLLLKTVCQELGRGLLAVDWILLKNEDLKQAAQDVKRELLLQNAYCCVTNLGGGLDREAVEMLYSFVDAVSRDCRIVFIVATREEANLLNGIHKRKTVEVRAPSRDESYELWHMYLPELGKEACDDLANVYQFTPKQIEELAAACREEKPVVTLKMVKRKCSAALSDIMGEKAQLIKNGFTFDDLVLPESEKMQMMEALNHIRCRHVVYDTWNFKQKYLYGRGLTMLFEGAPGTGKTMAASIISEALGLPAFKVDLSKVLSKYIGETEKQLSEIFDIAQRNNAILFFDETDALFGKRSEIKDSHDRYANIETSYLLQRIEEFQGVIVMATNFMKNIDDAFLRRIQYIIHFPYPNCVQRLALWKSCFPENIDEDMDFSYLAEHFELTGAMIKNIVLSAAFLAASEGTQVSSKIAMEHVVKALKAQMKKHGRIITDEELEPVINRVKKGGIKTCTVK